MRFVPRRFPIKYASRVLQREAFRWLKYGEFHAALLLLGWFVCLLRVPEIAKVAELDCFVWIATCQKRGQQSFGGC